MNCLFSSSNCHASLCYVTNLVSKYTTTSKDYSEGHLFNSISLSSHRAHQIVINYHKIDFYVPKNICGRC